MGIDVTLDPPETDCEYFKALHAAEGYFELGLVADCLESLTKLPDKSWFRPEALELQILASVHDRAWVKAIQYCCQSIERYPSMPFGYIHQAFAEHELGNTEGAMETLEGALTIICMEPQGIYNLGCYKACLNKSSQAIYWVNKALQLDPELSRWANRDPDLSEIRTHLSLQSYESE